MAEYQEFGGQFWVIVLTAGFGFLTVVGVFIFGLLIYRSLYRKGSLIDIESVMPHIICTLDNSTQAHSSLAQASKILSDTFENYLDRRNIFWELFGQVALAVLVVVVVAILLLTKTIESDAGLPILTAVVAFVIGKGIDVKGGRQSINGPTGSREVKPD